MNTTPTSEEGGELTDRRRWMAILARSETDTLEEIWHRLPDAPRYTMLRQPEIGLAMVRGRAGGTGQPFNLGEMTITRCVVTLANGAAGFAYVAGRDRRKAELAAVFDALLQDPARRQALEATVVRPLAETLARKQRRDAAAAAATRVDFFTVVRGDDA